MKHRVTTCFPQANSNGGGSNSGGGGAKGSAATKANGSGGGENGGLRVAENQVAKMMEEDMGTAMQ